MTSPLCPCGRPVTRPGDPCLSCQLKVLRALAQGCNHLASATHQRHRAHHALIDSLRRR